MIGGLDIKLARCRVDLTDRGGEKLATDSIFTFIRLPFGYLLPAVGIVGVAGYVPLLVVVWEC